MKKRIFSLAVLTALVASATLQAQLSIEIAGVGANRIPVAVADFGGDPATTRALTCLLYTSRCV